MTELDTSGNVIGTFGVGGGPTGIGFDGTHLWVADYLGNSVTELDRAGNVAGTFGVGGGPDALTFDGTHIWVANGGSNTVQRL